MWLVVAISLIIATLVKRLSYVTRTIILLTSLYVAFAISLSMFGIVSGGKNYALAFTTLTGLLLGFRAGLIAFAIFVISAGVMASLTVSETITLDTGGAYNSASVRSWATYYIHMIMTISLLLASSTFILSRLAEATHVLENRVKVESSQLAERDEELESANGEIKELTSMLPVCANCKNVRDDKGYWIQVEQYITGLTDVAISHSICPDCRDLLYPDFNSGSEPPQPES